MAINPNFLVAALDLSEVFVDKDTGEPLSGGIVTFYRDYDHITPKLVYTSQSNGVLPGPAYNYVPLPNPIVLSATGQFQDINGNNIPVYYYPVIGPNNTLDLYYITVTNAQGVQQFTRQAWPPNESTIQPPPVNSAGAISNQITNSQFLDVNFPLLNIAMSPLVGYMFNYTGAGTTTINIAPGWNLVFSYTGNGTITIGRTPIAGNVGLPYNPPYTLTIIPGILITSLQLIQTLPNNPDVFSPELNGSIGWISGSILIANGSTASISYQPNGGPITPILPSTTNASGGPLQYNATVQLPAPTNASTGDTGSVNIIIGLSITNPTTISNVQIVPLNSNIPNIPYDQRTANRERDFEFNVYKQPIFNKPINSYLIGWDFPLNPTQVSGNGTIGAQATGGAAGSFQAWDQTVIFQSVTNGVTIARSPTGNESMTVTANAAAVQFAIIQYLPNIVAREILNNPLSSQFTGLTNKAGGLGGTISLWYTANANLPRTGANVSLVTALGANGYPSAVVAGWNEVPRGNLGNAQFTVGGSTSTNFNDYGFSGWNLNGAAAANTASWFAIVVGFASFSNATMDTIDIAAVSLVPGSIPTRPAPQSQAAVLLECNQFYWSSFPPGIAPQQALGTQDASIFYIAQVAGISADGAQIFFPTAMISNPVNTTYNPINGNAKWYNISTMMDSGTPPGLQITRKGVFVQNPQVAGDLVGNYIAIALSCDSRLGL